jgi:hypothetical protein
VACDAVCHLHLPGMPSWKMCRERLSVFLWILILPLAFIIYISLSLLEVDQNDFHNIHGLWLFFNLELCSPTSSDNIMYTVCVFFFRFYLVLVWIPVCLFVFLFFTFHRSKLGYNNHKDIEFVKLLNTSNTKQLIIIPIRTIVIILAWQQFVS